MGDLHQQLDDLLSRVAELTVLLNLADHYLQATSFNSVGDVVEHTEQMREAFRLEIAEALTRQEAPSADHT